MGLFSIIGRILFASFFIFSAWLSFKELDADLELVGKEYAAKMAGPLYVWYSEEQKMGIALYFLSLFIFLKVIGGFLLISGLQISAIFLRLYLLLDILLFCGFYHFKVGEPKFFVLFQDFIQDMAFFGALMLFIELKYKIDKMKQLKKKVPKSKRL